ncbi:hypothetical protein G6O67_007035 [Ophiocordyceps sinensis]|uniref:Peptidase A1 domain-containing protein n=1 Tax=Ophiocordyceps sinensis TaxID=72228 RepID=A0A8H4LTG9_9HYPO|nr:hypothetical protein G6O67_007035 [Ophiocordyceps sinensis]
MRPTLAVFAGLLTLAASSTAGLEKRSSVVRRVANPDFTGRNGPRSLALAYRKVGQPLTRALAETLEGGSRGGAAVQSRDLGRIGLAGAGLAGLTGDDNSPDGGLTGDGNSLDGEQLIAEQASPQELEKQQKQPGAWQKDKQTGKAAAVPVNGAVEYVTEVQIGSQTLKLDFDTGSADFWVVSTKLEDRQTAANGGIYDSEKSNDFELIKDSTFNISYGDGSGAQGIVGTDTVSVGGASVRRQAVQLATRVTGSFLQEQNNAGLLGLAFSRLNTVKPQRQNTFFDNIKNSLVEPLFTADLRSNGSGSYTFGAIDESRFRGALAWIPVNETLGFWQFGSAKFAVGGGPAQEGTPGGQAIADTGTTLILADPKIVDGYYAKVAGVKKGPRGITFPCDQRLPDLDLDVGGLYMARVSGDEINFSSAGDGSKSSSPGSFRPLTRVAADCFGGLQASPPGTMGIYGDVFFRSQFVVFNGGNNSLGMAPHE